MQKTKRRKRNSHPVSVALALFNDGHHFEGLSNLKTIPNDFREQVISSLTKYVIEKINNVTLVDFTVNDLSMAYVASMRLIGLAQFDTLTNPESFHIYHSTLQSIYRCMITYLNCHKKPIPIKNVLSTTQMIELKTLTLANNRLGWMPKGTFFNVVTRNIVKQYLRKTITHYEVGIQATLHFLKPILKAMYNDYYLKNEYVLDTNLVFKLPENSQHLISALWETVKMNK